MRNRAWSLISISKPVAINKYFQGKATGQTKPNGETIVVITDRESDERMGVTHAIADASQLMKPNTAPAISLMQVGSNPKDTKFLKALNEQLKGMGAQFVLVDTVTFDDMEDMTLIKVLLNAIVDEKCLLIGDQSNGINRRLISSSQS